MVTLGPHKPATLYEAFLPSEARRLLNKLEFHLAPKYSCWLNKVVIKLNILGRWLPQHTANETLLDEEVQGITKLRNTVKSIINRQFRSEGVRFRLQRLYPPNST